MLYISCPYSHPDPSVREDRYHTSCRAAANLFRAGIAAFNPLANSVTAVEFGGIDLSHGQWLAIDIPILHRCDEVLILALPDWERSAGVRQEQEQVRSSFGTSIRCSMRGKSAGSSLRPPPPFFVHFCFGVVISSASAGLSFESFSEDLPKNFSISIARRRTSSLNLSMVP